MQLLSEHKCASMEPDSRSDDYQPPPSFIQPFEYSRVFQSQSSYDDYSNTTEPPQASSSHNTVQVEADSSQLAAVQLSSSAAAPLPLSTALCPPTQLLSDATATAELEECRPAALKRKGSGSATREWLPPTPIDSDTSPSPPSEDDPNLEQKKRTKYDLPLLPPAAPQGSTIMASLLDSDLWNNFKRVGNEMIVTKPGR